MNKVAKNDESSGAKKNKFMERSILDEGLLAEDQENPHVKFINSQDQTGNITEIQQENWKPAREHSYETMALADSQFNRKIRPAGFRSNGKMRKIKNNCLISKIKTKCRIKNKNPKLAVCITMYNEDEEELKRTLTGVIHNYNELRCDPELEFKKEDFIVFLVCDGYDRIPESFRKFAIEKQFLDIETLQAKGFVETLDKEKQIVKMKEMKQIMDKNITTKVPSNIIHMFQVQTWDFGLKDDILKGRRINFIFAIKQRNDGKINSHKWFFQGLCKYLKPDLCLMLDIGTQPDKHAIYKLYKYMKKHETCGGCCGEIEVDFSDSKEDIGTFLIKAAQFFEYKTGHAPDKANESFFGFNSVLPGAYSMFRWKAIKGDPLDEFFKGVNSQELPSCAEANEFLAEDRIMCLQIYIKKSEKYHLCYIPDAKARTDAPTSLAVLIKQRRRWMNGATFGTTKVFSHFVDMVSCNRTRHSKGRQIGMVFFLIYYILTFLSQFFTVGSMYATISVFLKSVFQELLESMGASTLTTTIISSLFDYVYIFLVLMAIIISLTTPVDKGVAYFKFLMVAFGILLVSTMIGIIMYLVKTTFWPELKKWNADKHIWEPQGEYNFSTLVLCGTIMMGVYLLPMILRPFDFLQNFRLYMVGVFSYIFMMPTFINVMAIYSMCNLHDISWGNRPANVNGQGIEAVAVNAQEQETLKLDYQVFRAHMVYMWLVLNLLYGGLSSTLTTGGYSQTINDGSIGFLEGYSLFLASLVVFKFIFAALYNLKWNFRVWTNPYYRASKYNIEKEFKKIRRERKYSTDEEEDENPDHNMLGNLKESIHLQVFDNPNNTELNIKSKNQEVDDSDNDDEDFEELHEEERHDVFSQSMMKHNQSRFVSTNLVKPNNNEHRAISQIRQVSGMSNNRRPGGQAQMNIIESVTEYDHDDPNFGGNYKPNERKISIRQPSPPQGILRGPQASAKDQANFFQNLGGAKGNQSDDAPQQKPVFSLGQAFGESEAQMKSNHKSVRFDEKKKNK